MDIRYTEKFYSVQGEALNTGKLCTWLRTFSCTLECKGFGQKEPGNPSSWEKQYTNEQIIAISSVEGVPTPKYGCDSAYSWSKDFRHLAKKEDTRTLATEIRNLIPSGSFGNKIGHVFTGGEPMMHQKAIAEILQHWFNDRDYPAWLCFETNGTVDLTEDLENTLHTLTDYGCTVYFSISPKLLHVAGEQPEKAIKPNIIANLINRFPTSYLKIVLNTDQRAWQQAEALVETVNGLVEYEEPEVWVMPVGGTFEQQDSDQSGIIADIAIAKEWNVSPRVHVMLWKNDQIGR